MFAFGVPRSVLLALLLSVGAVAGCISDDDAELPRHAKTGMPEGLVSFVGETAQPVPEPWRDLELRTVATGFSGGEPTIGVTSDGTIFTVAGGANLARSQDHGKSWQIVQGPTSDPLAPKASLDPWIWVDPDTDRIYNAPLYVVCTWAAWSDDLGESWDANPATGCGVPAHDHQKLTSGPPAEDVSTSGYPNVLYYSYNSFRREGTWISTSLDGGRTYSAGGVAHPPDCNHGGVAGPVAVGPDGVAYSPKPACDSFDVAVSYDSGATWEVTGRIDGAGISPALATTVDADVDDAGNAYGVYTGEDGRIFLTRSTDQGKRWSEPFVVSPPGVNVTVFSVVSAGDAGRIAIGYLGTDADADDWDQRTAQDAPDETVWHAYMTFSDDALADEPTFVTQQVTPDDDPVQVGCLWLSGGASDCRNLLDFIDMVQLDGRAYMVYADGCDGCDTAEESRRADVFVTMVERGPSLLGTTLRPLVDGST